MHTQAQQDAFGGSLIALHFQALSAHHSPHCKRQNIKKGTVIHTQVYAHSCNYPLHLQDSALHSKVALDHAPATTQVCLTQEDLKPCLHLVL